MKIRRIDIKNFRGIRELSWRLPLDQTFFVLIGPGDATKSTILTAIERALSDRWNMTFTDTDFHNANIDQPIRIRIALSDLPDDLLGLDELGQHLAGINEAGDWTHDPVEGFDVCIIVELCVEADLEPQWTIHRPLEAQLEQPTPTESGDEQQHEEQHPIKTKHRARLGAFRVDERVDVHLRWSRMSALGKLTAKKNDTKHTLTAANRAARDAAATAISADLQSLADDVGNAVRAIGSALFDDLKPGLDLSLGSAQGNLALFNGPVPLMNFGLGTRRLAGAATQQLANEDSTILLVDEVEYGLEPHRLVHLLRHLRGKDAFSQVLVTTHSPTALQHLEPSDLMMVRSLDGATTVRCLGHPEALKPVIKSTPEAFLARRVVLGEGKTEYGLALALMNAWDDEYETIAELPSAALGVVAAEGNGGVGTIQRALELRSVGYEVIALLDSDDSAANEQAIGLVEVGGKVVRWPGNLSVEQAVCAQLEVDGLTALLAAAVAAGEYDGVAGIIASQLSKYGAPATDEPLNVASWASTGMSLEAARETVGLAAKKSGWFKNVDRGKRLAELVLARPELQTGNVAETVTRLRRYIYNKPAAPEPPAEHEAGQVEPGEISAGNDATAEGETEGA